MTPKEPYSHFTSEIIKQNKINFKNLNDESDHNVEFDDDGDRLSANYEILNIQSNKLEIVGSFKVL
jgi:hypothetical protein